MARKNILKTLSDQSEPLVSVPAAFSALDLCNKSGQDVQVELSIKRGSNSFRLFGCTLGPRESTSILKERGLSLDGTDALFGRASTPDCVDFVCCHRETAGSGSLFNPMSWNDRVAWEESRGVEHAPFEPPQFVIDGLNAGASRWRSVASYSPAMYDAIESTLNGWSGLELQNYTQINADNGYLATCGVNLYVEENSTLNAVSFDLQVNTFYASQLTQREWDDIMTHEMGHGLGIGIFWSPSNFFLSGSSYPNCQAAYNSITSLNRMNTPVESSGGGGTASAHWEDDFRTSNGTDYYGVTNELMVGALVSEGMILSEMSVGALADFGYQTYAAAEGKPNISTASYMWQQSGRLKCGLSSPNIGKMMAAMNSFPIAAQGNFVLKRYIML